jgi:hypothetical protein
MDFNQYACASVVSRACRLQFLFNIHKRVTNECCKIHIKTRALKSVLGVGFIIFSAECIARGICQQNVTARGWFWLKNFTQSELKGGRDTK